MAPKCRLTMDSESKQAVQNRSLMVTRSQSSSVKIGDNNNSSVVVFGFAQGVGAPSSKWKLQVFNVNFRIGEAGGKVVRRQQIEVEESSPVIISTCKELGQKIWN
ncbi:hypothetical protein L1987_02704 [Smallanthus sonchifolius]|uniref:Uncharacterized protein n=1 Tax=Smallanthus sonchifolius TaxID=185202 RepID=A0ACB9K8H8_9ASTR|nr:hypothetical protein L1987_02704 [Smallanthus sonchifolius]